MVVPLQTGPQYQGPDFNLSLQAAIKNMTTNAVFYFTIPVSLEALFVPGAGMEVTALVAAWKGIEEALETSVVVNGM